MWNERYLDFATYSGFAPHACRPYRAPTKGKVARGIGYVRQNFWGGLHFRALDDLKGQAQPWLNEIANPRVQGTTGEVPFARLALEGLQPLPGHRFDTSIKVERYASRDCLVSYDGNFYSVPAAWAQKRRRGKETEDQQLIIRNGRGEVVAPPRNGPGRNQRIGVAAHDAGLPVLARPAAVVQALQTSTRPSVTGLSGTPPQVQARPLRVYAQLPPVSG